MVNFSKAALQKLEASLAPTDIIRIRAIVGGCSGVSYSLEIEDDPFDNDIVADMSSFKVCLDPYSKFLVKDLVVDYVQTENGSGFKFGDSDDPSGVKDCDCVRASVC